ncbi:hypothetical protein PCCS19_57980 [Paenibacillus sp. CCS19]|uniref:hypothetical protein n=1 Tax=Paenibacillus sp. CCS19 TaxID=3158387 RepID=UPI00256B098A|nr:hypothetical protein [Paenibacillus cellulosilyticus]GMK42738.1 hypothetical protein PCCS19_57980 [Paenibacillus cellulosilyticus]
MNKSLSRSEMLISLGFLFMLVCAVGAFFFGVEVGKNRTTTQLEASKESTDKKPAAGTLQQQDLVSFYHTVFMPYREFQTQWIEVVENANTRQTTDLPTELKRLASLSQKTFNEISAVSMPVSTVLDQSQQQLLKSISSFQTVSKRLANSKEDISVTQILAAMRKDQDYKLAVSKSLQGQQSYYNGMVQWARTIKPDLAQVKDMPSTMKTSIWKSLPLIVKNKLSADLITASGSVVNYYPQDLTSRIDEFISSGQADKLKYDLVGPISELLIDTKAVRSGDFKSSMVSQYAKQLLPQLPFFLTDES